ncbi:uncharacterized protein LOC135501468 [Lineus longissimus]|uniref:uncharacterized protein LOC135501468 n=1 Tax=Lineus longissimus TaxID=88925 RepID=UPI002B4D48DF
MAGGRGAILTCLFVLLYHILCAWGFVVEYGPSSPRVDDGESTSAACPADYVMIRCEVDIRARADGSKIRNSTSKECSAYSRGTVGSVKAVNVCMYGKNVVKELVTSQKYTANPSFVCPAGYYMFGCNDHSFWGESYKSKVIPFLQPDGLQGCRIPKCARCRLQLHCIEGGVVKKAIRTAGSDARVKTYTMKPVFGPIPFTLKVVNTFTTTTTFKCCKECLSFAKCDYIIHLTTVGICHIYAS